MTPGDSRVPVAVLRDAAHRRAAETSLRTTAAEIGLSYSGLRTFLRGTEPYAPTLAKLRAWYATTEAGQVEQARAALALLVSGLPKGKRRAAERRMLELLREMYQEAGEVPEWME